MLRFLNIMLQNDKSILFSSGVSNQSTSSSEQTVLPAEEAAVQEKGMPQKSTKHIISK